MTPGAGPQTPGARPPAQGAGPPAQGAGTLATPILQLNGGDDPEPAEQGVIQIKALFT